MTRTVLVAAGLKAGDGLILFRRNDAQHCCSYQALMLRSTENASLSHGGTDRTLTPSVQEPTGCAGSPAVSMLLQGMPSWERAWESRLFIDLVTVSGAIHRNDYLSWY